MKGIAVAAIVMLASNANAAECSVGSPNVFTFTEVWAKKTTNGTAVALFFKNATERIIRTMHSSVILSDKTGELIGTHELTFDGAMIPNVPDRADFRVRDMDRLTTMRAEDVVGAICTTSVIYEEGDVEKFE